jgi:ectoine hydroxylase-related dioxygenase (phytanoyl-CoA dioxygenase family)
MPLTHEQIRHFRHCGYLKLPDCLPLDTVTQLKKTIHQDIADQTEPVVRDQTDRVIRISQVLDRAPIFHQAATHPPLLDALESLLGPHVELVKNRHNHATLNLATATRDSYHRDAVQWTRSLVTTILYLEDTNLDNGCTHIVPGTQQLPGLDLLHRVEEEQWVAVSGLLAQAIPVPMPAGGILLIDGLVFHRIGQNHTQNTRMSITLGFHSADELSDAEDPKRILVRGERNYRGNDRKSS